MKARQLLLSVVFATFAVACAGAPDDVTSQRAAVSAWGPQGAWRLELSPCTGHDLSSPGVHAFPVDGSGGLYTVFANGEAVCQDDAANIAAAGGSGDVLEPPGTPESRHDDGTPLPAVTGTGPNDGTPLPAATGPTQGTPLPAFH